MPVIQEQTAKGEEPQADTTEETSEVKPDASTPEADASETPELKYSEADFNAQLEARSTTLAQSLKDRELKPIYAERDTLKQEVKDLKLKVEDRQLNALEKAEREGWEAEGATAKDINDIHSERRRVINEGRKLEDARDGLRAEAEKVGKTSRATIIRELTLQYGLTEKEQEDVTKVGDSADGLELASSLMEVAALKLSNTRSPKKTVTKKPDSSINTAPGKVSGHKPSLAELQASTPQETDKKIKSGEWVW